MVWICWINQRCLEKYLHSLHLSLCERDGLMNSSRSPSLKKYASPIPKPWSIYTHPPDPANVSCPKEQRSPGEDMIMMDTACGFGSPYLLLLNLFPAMWRKYEVNFSEKKIKRITHQTVAVQAVDTEPTLGAISVTELRNLCCPAIQAETPQPLRAAWRSVLSCVTKLHCYDPADGGGHFPGNEVTDSH